MNEDRDAWQEVCMMEYRITGDMLKATACADSVEQRFRTAALREAATKLDLLNETESGVYAMGWGGAVDQLRRLAEETT